MGFKLVHSLIVINVCIVEENKKVRGREKELEYANIACKYEKGLKVASAAQ